MDSRILDQVAQNQEDDKLDKHRFLVQSKVIDDVTYERLMALDPGSRAEEMTKLWDGPKDDKKSSVKLKVEFKYPSQAPRATSSRQSTGAAESKASSARGEESGSAPEVMVSELQAMRKKYDAVVEYTVHLTSERDSIVAQLESLQRELNKERAKKKGDAGTKSVQSDKVDKKLDKVTYSSLLIISVFVFCA